jgi:hypothetical protein
MFYELAKYGGVITIILSWTNLVIPFLFLKNKRNFKFISEVCGKSRLGMATKLGVMACGLSQILFSYYLYLNFSALLARIGIVSYGVGSMFFFWCGVVDYCASPKLHNLFCSSYYVLMSLGFILLSFSLPLSSKILAASLLLVPLYFYFLKHNLTKVEIATIIISNLFALSVYHYLSILNFV